MNKFLLLSLVLLTVSCKPEFVPVPTETLVPSPIPEPTLGVPMLVKEIELGTRTGTSYTLDWSHDGITLAAGSGYEITMLSKDLSERLAVLEPKPGALGVAWSPDGSQIASIFGYQSPEIIIWNWDGGTRQLTQSRQLEGGSDQYGVSWSPDGRLLATLADDDNTTIQIWDTSTWEQIHRIELPYSTPRRALNWSADSTRLYEAGESGNQAVVFEVDVADGTVRELTEFPIAEMYVFAISPDGKTIAAGDKRGNVQFVDAASKDVIANIQTVDQPVDVAWNPDGRTLAILGYKTALQLWEVMN